MSPPGHPTPWDILIVTSIVVSPLEVSWMFSYLSVLRSLSYNQCRRRGQSVILIMTTRPFIQSVNDQPVMPAPVVAKEELLSSLYHHCHHWCDCYHDHISCASAIAIAGHGITGCCWKKNRLSNNFVVSFGHLGASFLAWMNIVDHHWHICQCVASIVVIIRRAHKGTQQNPQQLGIVVLLTACWCCCCCHVCITTATTTSTSAIIKASCALIMGIFASVYTGSCIGWAITSNLVCVNLETTGAKKGVQHQCVQGIVRVLYIPTISMSGATVCTFRRFRCIFCIKIHVCGENISLAPIDKVIHRRWSWCCCRYCSA